MLLSTVVVAATLAAVVPPGLGESLCLPGFCPLPSRVGPPSGLMFLAVGLIGVGVGGLWRRRVRPGG